MRFLEFTLSVVACLLVTARSSATEFHFETLDFGSEVELTSISNDGVITGFAHGRSFVRSPDGELQWFEFPGALRTYLHGSNNVGDSVGYAYFEPSFERHPFVLHADGTFTDLLPDGETMMQAMDINDQGFITGFRVTTSHFDTFVRDPSGESTYFAGIVPFSSPSGINNSGLVSATGGAGGAIFGYILNTNSGDIEQIFYEGENGVTYGATVNGINNVGQTVGWWMPDVGPEVYGFLRQPNGRFIDVMFPGSRWTSPAAINDHGQMVGFYEVGSPISQRFAFIATPVPEPQSGILGAIALSIAALFSKQRAIGKSFFHSMAARVAGNGDLRSGR